MIARPPRISYNPTPKQLVGAMKTLRASYPFVKDFSTWNEANMNKKPELVAKWWLAMRKACPSCTVLGTDLLDKPNMIPWAQRFVKAAKRTPKVWGLHNYVDANTLSTKTTRKLLQSIGGNIWFTETGGIVRRNNNSALVFPTGTDRAAQVTTFIFGRLAKLSPRIQRVYLYHWDTGVGGGPTWDSGFIGPEGETRPALAVLQGVRRPRGALAFPLHAPDPHRPARSRCSPPPSPSAARRPPKPSSPSASPTTSPTCSPTRASRR